MRQPWVELILRGIKTLEIRSQPTSVRGPIYLYAAKTIASEPFARDARREHDVSWEPTTLQRLVGVVEIVGCRPTTPADVAASCVPAASLANHFAWELANPQRLDVALKPRFLPYGVWFYPFQRRSQGTRSRRGAHRPASSREANEARRSDESRRSDETLPRS